MHGIKVHWNWIRTPILVASTLEGDEEELNAAALIDGTNIGHLPTILQTSYVCQCIL
jgi:hypothetical protein